MCDKGFLRQHYSRKQPVTLPAEHTSGINSDFALFMQGFSEWCMTENECFFPFHGTVNMIAPPHTEFFYIRRVTLFLDGSFGIKAAMNKEVLRSVQPERCFGKNSICSDAALRHSEHCRSSGSGHRRSAAIKLWSPVSSASINICSWLPRRKMQS